MGIWTFWLILIRIDLTLPYLRFQFINVQTLYSLSNSVLQLSAGHKINCWYNKSVQELVYDLDCVITESLHVGYLM